MHHDPPFVPGEGEHAARMEEVVSRLWRALDLEAPTPARPLASLACALDECGLLWHEMPGLTRRDALLFLQHRGIAVDSIADDISSAEEGSGASAFACGEEPLAGFLFANEGGGCVFVREEDPVARRRFSVAHELGHFVLHFAPRAAHVFERRAREPFTSSEPVATPGREATAVAMARVCDEPRDESPAHKRHRRREQEANAFAAEMLMPRALVSLLASREREQWGDSDLIWRLAGEFLVSRKAMWVRLSQLGWVSSASPYEL